MGCKEKYIPCGIVDEDSAALHITFGSSYKTSDFIVDTIEAKWNAMDEQEKAETSLIQIKMDNGPESSGRRTQFLSRMVQFADVSNRPIHLLYYPPYHSKYNPTTLSSFDIIAPIRYARPAYHVQLQEAADVTSVSDSRQRVCDSHL